VIHELVFRYAVLVFLNQFSSPTLVADRAAKNTSGEKVKAVKHSRGNFQAALALF